MNSERFTFDEACHELGVTEEELEQLVAAGEIASIKDGDTLFFKKDVLRKFKKNRESTPTILLSDEEINLLEEEGPEEIELEGGKPAKAGAGGKKASPTEALAQTGALRQQAPAKAEPSRVEIPLEDDLNLDDIEIRAPGEEAEAGETKKLPGAAKKVKEPASISEDETLVSFDGLLEEDSEATTPVPGGGVEDDRTLLDTDLLDLGGQTDPFSSDTVEEGVGAGATEAGTLLRGGGARVMQMKRKQGHPLMTAILALSCILLLLPLGIMTNLLFAHSHSPEAKDTLPAKDSYGWIMDFNVLDGAVEGVADLFKDSK
jgi:excisionase family DNA binding protein